MKPPLEACEEAHWQPFLVASQMDRAAAKYERTLRPSEMLMRIILPVFAQAGFAFEKLKANRDCTRAIIDVLLFRNRHGRLPKSLGEAGVKAIDPFDGKPLKYRITDLGFVVYSAGQNGKDDGGLLPWERAPENSSWEKRDEPMAVYPSWERSGERTSTTK